MRLDGMEIIQIHILLSLERGMEWHSVLWSC